MASGFSEHVEEDAERWIVIRPSRVGRSVKGGGKPYVWMRRLARNWANLFLISAKMGKVTSDVRLSHKQQARGQLRDSHATSLSPVPETNSSSKYWMAASFR